MSFRSDSEPELARPAKRPRRFAFKDLKQRIDEVDIDVYRRAASRRQAPLPGATCFTQEALAAWRELNTAADFTEVATEIHNMVQSLPLLVHHGAEVANALIRRVHINATLSADAVMALLGTLPRDLKEGFLPMVPTVIDRLTSFVSEGGYKQPEMMQHVFACLSSIFKHLQKLLAADLRKVLAMTFRLRYYPASYIRALTAQSVGLLFRHAPSKHLAAAVKAVAMEAALRPTARTNAAGQLLATAVHGISHGLHSRVSDVWRLLLRADLLRPSAFKSEKAKAQLSRGVLRDRTAALAAAFVDAILHHAHRTACMPIIDAAILEVDHRIDQLSDAGDSEAKASVARAASLVAHMASYHHGSRVSNWQQLASLASRLLTVALPIQSAEVQQEAMPHIPDDSRDDVLGASASACVSAGSEGEERLIEQTISVLLAVIIGHCQSVGQSDGLSALRGHLQSWSAALERLSTNLVPRFVGPLLKNSTTARLVSQELGGTLMQLLGRAVLKGQQDAAAVAALPLLVDMCHLQGAKADGCQSLLLQWGSYGEAVAEVVRHIVSCGLQTLPSDTDLEEQEAAMLLCMLQLLPFSVSEASEVVDICVAFVATTPATSSNSICRDSQSDATQQHSMVSLLRAEALRTAAAAAAACAPWRLPALIAGALAAVRQDPVNYHYVAAAAAILDLAGVKEHPSQELPGELLDSLAPNLAAPSSGLRRETLQLLCCWLAPSLPQGIRKDHIAEAPGIAATPVSTAPASQNDMPSSQSQSKAAIAVEAADAPQSQGEVHVLVEHSHPQSDVAEDDQSALSSTARSHRSEEGIVARSDVLHLLLALEKDDPPVGLGRLSAVTLRRIGSYLEYGTVPDCLVAPVVLSLLGSLHIRLSTLWPAASGALTSALTHCAPVAWPLLMDSLAATQAVFLSGNSQGVHPTFQDDEDATADQRQEAVWRLRQALAAGSPGAHGGCTDASVRLSHIIKALGQAPAHLLQDRSRAWVPLMLAYAAAKSTGPASPALLDKPACSAKEAATPVSAWAPPQTGRHADPSEILLDDLSDAEPNDAEASALATNGDLPTSGDVGVVSLASHVGGQAWRSHLKEWLAVVAAIKGARGLFQWQSLRRAVALQLSDIEPAVQKAALECLKVFKVKYVVAYFDRLVKLADNETLRAQLACFPLAPDAPEAILPEHRAGLAAVLARLLLPKLRKRTGRLGGRGAPGSARAAILNFFASAPPGELLPLLTLLLAPFGTAFVPPLNERAETLGNVLTDDRLVEDPWWAAALNTRDLLWWLSAVDGVSLAAHPLRQRLGLLHALEDLVKHLGHRLKEYLPPILASVQALLERAAAPVAAAAQGEAASDEEGDRELRSGTLKLLANILKRFPHAVDFGSLWPKFMSAAEPLIPRLVIEASSDRAPPLLEVAAAVAAEPHLAVLLWDNTTGNTGNTTAGRTMHNEFDEHPASASPHLGSRLLAAVVKALGAAHCSAASRDIALSVVEHLLSHRSEVPEAEMQQDGGSTGGSTQASKPMGSTSAAAALEQHRPELLKALRSLVIAAMGGGSPDGRGLGKRSGHKAARHSNPGAAQGTGRRVALRALTALEHIAASSSGHGDWDSTQLITAALLPLLPGAGSAAGRATSHRRSTKGLDEGAATRVLHVLAALWQQLPPATLDQQGLLRSYVSVLAPLSGSLTSREAQSAIAAAFAALAKGPLPSIATTSQLLSGMLATSTTMVDEADYDARLASYAELSPSYWAASPPWHAAPLVYAALAELRSADDIALRHAAAQALERLVDGVSLWHRRHYAAADVMTATPSSSPHVTTSSPSPVTTEQIDNVPSTTSPAEAVADSAADLSAENVPRAAIDNTGGDAPGSPLTLLLHRILLPRCKAMLGASNLAVRQEHLALLRRMALAFPASFPDLSLLADNNDDLDFFVSVAHLQLHRRTRALGRLVKLLERPTDEAGKSDVGVGTLLGIITPLLQQMIAEGRAAEGGGHELKSLDRDKEANVVAAAVDALGAVAKVLPWPAYSQLLGRFLRLLAAHGNEKKGIVRAVCAIVDAFHFEVPDGDLSTTVVPMDVTSQPVSNSVSQPVDSIPHQAPAKQQASEPEGQRPSSAAPCNMHIQDGGATMRWVPVTRQTANEVTSQQSSPQHCEHGIELRASGPQDTTSDANTKSEAAAQAEATRVSSDVSSAEHGEAADVVDIHSSQVADEAAVQSRHGADIRSALLKRVLPALNAQLVAKGDVVRPPVGLAVVKVLAVLPLSDRTAALPGVLHTVANVLKSRHQGVRDEARKVFVAMVAELGAPYLRFGVEVLQGALPAKGYTAQVLGYTTHALLDALSHGCAPGGFDDGLPVTLDVIEADLFGEAAEAKDAGAVSGSLQEGKKQRGYEAYRLLAANTTFRTHLAYLLSPVRRRLAHASDAKLRNKLGALLQHAARGIAQNPTAVPADVLLFCFTILSDGLQSEEDAIASSSAAATAALPHDLPGEAASGTGANGGPAGSQAAHAAHEWLLVEFALTLLHGGIKRGTLGGRTPQQLAEMDPLLPLLARALHSRHSDVVSLSLRCLCFLVRLPSLPGLPSAAGAAGKAAADLLVDAPSSGEGLAQDCIKLLAGLLNTGGFEPRPAQLGRLLKIAFADVEETASRQTAFSLLKAVMAKGVVVPEVYDIITRVEKLLVRSHAAPVRDLAMSTLLQYLVEYPVGHTRIQRHLAFLLANLEYEHEAGRLAVLSALSGVVRRFPQEVLDEAAEQLALPLVLRLVNDPSATARAAAAEVVSALFAAITPNRLEQLMAYTLEWLAASDARLRRAACQVVGILARQEGRRFGRRIAAVMPPLAALLRTTAAAAQPSIVAGTKEDGSQDSEAVASAATGWQEPYAGLLLLQTLHSVAPKDTAFSSPLAAEAWRAAVALSLHNHAWVRSAASRLLGIALADRQIEPLLLAESATSAGKLAYVCIRLLESPTVDEKLAKQAVKNALHVARPLAESAAAAAASNSQLGAAPSSAATATTAPAGTELHDSLLGAVGSEHGHAEEAAEEADAAEAAGNVLSAAGLMRRIARLAGDESVHREVARAAAMGFIGAAAVTLRPQGSVTTEGSAPRQSSAQPHLLRPFLVSLLQPLVRATEAHSTSSNHFQALGAEVLASLRANLSDGDGYAAALNAARAAIAARRQERSQSRALKRVLDPEAMARERERKGHRKSHARKLRQANLAVKRGKGLAVKNRRQRAS